MRNRFSHPFLYAVNVKLFVVLYKRVLPKFDNITKAHSELSIMQNYLNKLLAT